MISPETILPNLSPDELKLINLICKSLVVNYNSVNNKIKSAEIILKLSERGIIVKDEDVRSVIRWVKRNDYVSPGFILTSSTGFWYSEDEKEMEQVYRSEWGRAIEVLTNIKPLYRRFKHLHSVSLPSFDFDKI